MNAVALGDEDGACRAMELLMTHNLGNRFETTLRGRKNALIVFNTLLRKSIEGAHVHPYYINEDRKSVV